MKTDARSTRLYKRNLFKALQGITSLKKKLSKMDRQAIAFKNTVFIKKKEYDKQIQYLTTENIILRQSLKNFAAATNKQRKQIIMMKKSRRGRHKTRAVTK
jgi:hypothetical protein